MSPPVDPRSPTPPLDPRGWPRWIWQLTKDVVDDYRRDGAGDLAAAITFWAVLSIPAAVLALVSALGELDRFTGASVADDVRRRVLDFIADQFVDSTTISDAVEELFGAQNTGVLTLATVIALFTLSRTFAGLIRALDRAYGVEDGRRWWHARLVAIGLGIGTLVVVTAAAVVLAFLPSTSFHWLARWLTVPIVMAALTIWAATLYHIGPNHRTPWRYDVPGAVVTAVGWAGATQLFAVYVRFTGGRNQVQSTVGAVLLALTLMYLLSLVMIVGAEVNEVISRRAGVVQEPRTARAIASSIRRRLERRTAVGDDDRHESHRDDPHDTDDEPVG